MLMGFFSRLTMMFALSSPLLMAHAQTAVNLGSLPLLPTTDKLSAGPGGPASPDADAVLKEDGLKRQESRGAAPGAWVNAYEFSDATGAYAAYTYFAAGGRAAGGVNATEVKLPSGEQIFQAGTSVVRASAQVPVETLKQINIGLPKIGGRRGLAPLLPTLVPAEGLERDSIRYALGPAGYTGQGGVLPDASLLGFDKSAEVATAKYHGGKDTLTLLLYPTPQIAGERGRAIQDSMNKVGVAQFGSVRMRRLGPLVGVTTGDWKQAQADEMLASLKLNQEITFSQKVQPEFHAEIRKTYSLFQSIALFTIFGILASVVLAVFLGGARVGLRVLRGKPIEGDPEFLQLDLRGRPSALQDAKDEVTK